ncbi:MAG TPA: Ig-like domain-containing protein [Polyangiaceae bacterium]|nr:Ig-like domain-containing protein [Polyangiaceae bacterium]
MKRRAFRLLALLAALGACDTRTGALDPAHGPALRVLSTSPADGEGADCARDDLACGVPLDAEIRIQFNRPLLPASAVRQSIRIYTGTPANGAPFLTPTYDVLTRQLRFRLNGRLQSKALYRAELLVAGSPAEPGLRAFDGALLREGPAPLSWSFMTSGQLAPVPEPAPPALPEPTCDDISALLSTNCASGCCHGADEPPFGLRLDGKEGLLGTAINHVARETETGNAVGVTYVNPARFGVGMPIIAPGAPANSYLIYKLLLKPENFGPCVAEACGPFQALADDAGCLPLDEAESTRLREWFVQGEPMPLGWGRGASCENVPVDRHLDCGTLRALTRWIDTGAHCP